MVCQSIRQIDGLKGPMLPCASCATLRRVPRERRDRMRRRAHRYRARRRRRGAVARRAGARLVPYHGGLSRRHRYHPVPRLGVPVGLGARWGWRTGAPGHQRAVGARASERRVDHLVPLPDDTVAQFLIAATGGGPDSSRFVYTARIAPQFRPPRGRTVWIDTTSFTPAGTLALPLEEGIPLTVQATPGATVRLQLPWGSSVPLVPDTLAPELPGAVRAFVIDTAPRRRVPTAGRYVGWLPAAALCTDGRTACATLVVTAGGGADTATARWPLAVTLVDRTFPTVVVLADDTAHTGTTDSLSPGRTVPHGTYNWFFPTGTVAVESGRWNDQVRLRLSRATVAWVNEADVVRLPPGTPPPGGVVSSVRLASGPKSVTLRVPLPARLPYQITERERSLTLRLYGGASDINWMQYGEGGGGAGGGGAAGTDPLVARMSYAQPAADEVTITLELTRRVWGYRARFDGRDLLLEVRRPPVFDREHPLRGRTVVLDPGHPPLGAKGPTGLWEPVATLAVALKAETLLERA